MTTIEQVIKTLRGWAETMESDSNKFPELQWRPSAGAVDDLADALEAEVRRGPVAWMGINDYTRFTATPPGKKLAGVAGEQCLSNDVALFAAPQPAIPDWRPIETAPRDGSQFIATDETHVEVCAWHDGAPEQLEFGVVTDPGMDAGFWGGEHIYPGGSVPTRWMPLPPPPSDDAGSGSG